MKTNLNAQDLLFIFNVLEKQLRFANYPKPYKDHCNMLCGKIEKCLAKIKVELNDDRFRDNSAP